MDQNGCPDDYDDLVRHYFAMARSIVAKYPGVRPDDVEDLTQDILLKFYVRDALSWYDPNKTFQTAPRPANGSVPEPVPIVREEVPPNAGGDAGHESPA